MEWRRLTQPEEPAFGRAMALYEASFPRHEQRLPDEQRAVLSHPEYHFTQLFDGAEFVGLLLYWEAEDFRYVEHFAIAPQLRGQSWGSRALREFLAEGDPVVLEIDPPEDPVSRRRKGFYEGLGLVSNPWPHIHPPFRLEFSGHALEVMTFPGGWDEGQYRRFARYLDETVMADRPQKAAGA